MALEEYGLQLKIDYKDVDKKLEKVDSLLAGLQKYLDTKLAPVAEKAFAKLSDGADTYEKELKKVSKSTETVTKSTEKSTKALAAQSDEVSQSQKVLKGFSAVLLSIGAGLVGVKGIIWAAEKWGASLKEITAITRQTSVASQGMSAIISAFTTDKQVRSIFYFARRAAHGFALITAAAHRVQQAMQNIDIPDHLRKSSSITAKRAWEVVESHNAMVPVMRQFWSKAGWIGAALTGLGALGVALATTAKGINKLGKSTEEGGTTKSRLEGLFTTGVGAFVGIQLATYLARKYDPQIAAFEKYLLDKLKAVWQVVLPKALAAGGVISGLAVAAKDHAIKYATLLGDYLRTQLPRIGQVISRGFTQILAFGTAAKDSAVAFVKQFITGAVDYLKGAGATFGAAFRDVFGKSTSQVAATTAQVTTQFTAAKAAGSAFAGILNALGKSLRAVMPVIEAFFGFWWEIEISRIIHDVGNAFEALGDSILHVTQIWVEAAAEMESSMFALEAGVAATSESLDEVSPRTERWSKMLRELSLEVGANVADLTLASARTMDLARAFELSDDTLMAMITRAADFGAAVHRDVEEVLYALIVAMQGIPGPAKRMGLALTEGEVNASEYARELGRTTKQMTQVQKAQAFASTFLEQTVKFQGKAAESQKTYNQQLKAAASNWYLVEQALGEGSNVLNQLLIGPGVAFSEWVASFPEGILKATGVVASFTGIALKLMGMLINLTATFFGLVAVVKLVSKLYAWLTTTHNAFIATILRETVALGGLNAQLNATASSILRLGVIKGIRHQFHGFGADTLAVGGLLKKGLGSAVGFLGNLLKLVGALALRFAPWIALIGTLTAGLFTYSKVIRRANKETGAIAAAQAQAKKAIEESGSSWDELKAKVDEFSTSISVGFKETIFRSFTGVQILLMQIPAQISESFRDLALIHDKLFESLGISEDHWARRFEKLVAGLGGVIPTYLDVFTEGVTSKTSQVERSIKFTIDSINSDLAKSVKDITDSLEQDPIPETFGERAADAFYGILQGMENDAGVFADNMVDTFERIPDFEEMLVGTDAAKVRQTLQSVSKLYLEQVNNLERLTTQIAKFREEAARKGGKLGEEEYFQSQRLEQSLADTFNLLAKFGPQVRDLSRQVKAFELDVSTAVASSVSAAAVQIQQDLDNLERRYAAHSEKFANSVADIAYSLQASWDLVLPPEQEFQRKFNNMRTSAFLQVSAIVNKLRELGKDDVADELISNFEKAFNEVQFKIRDTFGVQPVRDLAAEADYLANAFETAMEATRAETVKTADGFETLVVPLYSTIQLADMVRDKVIPAYTAAGRVIDAKLIAAIDRGVDASNRLADANQRVTNNIRHVAAAAKAAWSQVIREGTDAANKAADTITDIYSEAMTSIGDMSADIVYGTTRTVEEMDHQTGETIERNVSRIEHLKMAFMDLFETINRMIIKTAAQMAATQIIEKIGAIAAGSSSGGGTEGATAEGGGGFLSGVGDWLRNIIPGFQEGGVVPGIGNKDSVPAMLTPGEAVIPKNMVPALSAALGMFHNITGAGDELVSVLKRTAGMQAPYPMVPARMALGGIVPAMASRSHQAAQSAGVTPQSEGKDPSLTIVNVTDQSMVLDALASTEGRNVILNTLRRASTSAGSPQRFVMRGFK